MERIPVGTAQLGKPLTRTDFQAGGGGQSDAKREGDLVEVWQEGGIHLLSRY